MTKKSVERKADLLNLIHASESYVTQSELAQALKIPSSSLSPIMAQLVAEGEVLCLRPPPSYGRGIGAIYGSPTCVAPAGATPVLDKAQRAPRLSPKVTGFRAAARAKKRQAKKRLHAPADRAYVSAPAPAPAHDNEPRWAVTSFGSLMLLDSAVAVELQRPQVLSLVKFLRLIDSSGLIAA